MEKSSGSNKKIKKKAKKKPNKNSNNNNKQARILGLPLGDFRIPISLKSTFPVCRCKVIGIILRKDFYGTLRNTQSSEMFFFFNLNLETLLQKALSQLLCS